MDPVEIIYVDDQRNAGGDHRTGSPGGSSGVPMPVGAMRPGAPRPMVAYAQPAQGYPQQALAVRPMVFANPNPQWDPRRLFGNLTVGGALDLAAEGIAALWPLPVAPVTTGDTSTDVQNHVLYQTALAVHTKRDERIRTLGTVLSRLIG